MRRSRASICAARSELYSHAQRHIQIQLFAPSTDGAYKISAMALHYILVTRGSHSSCVASPSTIASYSTHCPPTIGGLGSPNRTIHPSSIHPCNADLHLGRCVGLLLLQHRGRRLRRGSGRCLSRGGGWCLSRGGGWCLSGIGCWRR